MFPSMVEYLQTAWTPWRVIVLGVESTSVSWCYASTNALGRWRIALLLSSSWPDHTHWLDLCQAQQINLRTFRQALQNSGLAHLVLRFGAGTSAPWEQDSSRHAQSLHTHEEEEEEEGRKTSLIPESDKFFRLSQNYGTPKIMAHPHNYHQTYGLIGHLVQTRMRSHLQRLGALWQHLRWLNGKTFQAMVQLILWINPWVRPEIWHAFPAI